MQEKGAKRQQRPSQSWALPSAGAQSARASQVTLLPLLFLF